MKDTVARKKRTQFSWLQTSFISLLCSLSPTLQWHHLKVAFQLSIRHSFTLNIDTILLIIPRQFMRICFSVSQNLSKNNRITRLDGVRNVYAPNAEQYEKKVYKYSGDVQGYRSMAFETFSSFQCCCENDVIPQLCQIIALGRVISSELSG